MRSLLLSAPVIAMVALAGAFPASAEPYADYLARLRIVCEVDCLEPRDFQKAARKRESDVVTDMALIMDVVDVRRNGDRYQLLSMDLEGNALIERELLGSAGISTSSSNGIGGLPRSQQGGSQPNLIVIEIGEEALWEFLNAASPAVEGVLPVAVGEGIVVEGDRKFIRPSLGTLRSHFRNRRVVVRGQPRLQPVLIGARRDFRRKQVTLDVDQAEHIVLLPRYDKNGEPIRQDLP